MNKAKVINTIRT